MFKDRLKELREGLNLTQAELAEKLDIGRASVSNYELGSRTPDIETLRVISNFFNVTTDYLVGNSTYKTVEEAYRFRAMELDEVIEKFKDVTLKNVFEHVIFPIEADIRKQEMPSILKLYESLYKEIACIYAISVICNSSDKEKYESQKEYFEAYNRIRANINLIIDKIALNYISIYIDGDEKSKYDPDLIKLCKEIIQDTKKSMDI